MIRIASAEIIELAGPDAVAFAHAQFSSDVRSLAVDDWQWSAWLDAQGRARNVFALLHPEPERLVIWQPRGNAEEMAVPLMRYVMRAKLQIVQMHGWHLYDADSNDEPRSPARLSHEHGGWSLDLTGPPTRRALLAPDLASTFEAGDDEAVDAWTRADIAAQLPWISTETAGQFVAPALGLQRLGAISLDKGCYPGQEIVARLHYRGGNKRHCHRVLIRGDIPPPPGSAIVSHQADTTLGTILYSASCAAGSDALAILPESMIAAGNLTLASGTPVEIMSSAQTGSTVD